MTSEPLPESFCWDARLLTISLCVLLCHLPVLAAGLYSETFDAPALDGKGLSGSSGAGITTNMSGVTNWTVGGGSDLDGDISTNWWRVVNQHFEGQDVGTAIATWESRAVTVPPSGFISLGMTHAKLGEGHNTGSEYLEVGYRLDGGPMQPVLLIDQTNQDAYDGLAWSSAPIDVATGSQVQLATSILNNGGDDGWAFDDVSIKSEAAPSNMPPSLVLVPDREAYSVTLGKTLSVNAIATEAVADAGDIITLQATTNATTPTSTFPFITDTGPLTNTFRWTPTTESEHTVIISASDIDGTTAVTVTVSAVGFPADRVWINEIHYDNDGSDTNEGVEVAGRAGTSLNGYALVFYNGSNGSEYDTLPLTGTIDSEVGSPFGAVWFPQAGIQNGDPDGIAMMRVANNTTNFIHFLSYDGSFTASDGPLQGLTSTDIGATEPTHSPIDTSLQLTGTGHGYKDFTWSGPVTHSRGQLNEEQRPQLPGLVIIAH